jgi:hypothetical protein
MPLKAAGTPYAKRCEGPASQGKRVHFREGRKNLLRSVQKIVLEGPETLGRLSKPGSPRTGLRPWGGKPMQNRRSPQGGG